MSPGAIGRRTFAALANPNYRRWYAGQGISLVGTWMQTIAQGWLVYTLTGSGTQLGLVVALQMVPVLILAPYAGVIADRVNKRKLIIGVQAGMAVLALILGILTVTGAVRLWEVYVLAAALGIATAFDNPTRQAFVMELVGPDHVRNAVTLNSVLVNAGSYVAVIASLLLLDTSTLRPSTPAPRSRGQLREGLRYVASTPALAVPLAMMGVIGALAYEFQVVLPLVARETFGGGAEVYGFLTAAMGAGAVVGGLIVAGSGRTGTRAVVSASFGFGVAILLAAAAPTLPLELVAMTLVGAASVTFLAVGNSTLQLASRPDMRGRVMSLWAVAFLGTTPIGGPIAGYVSENAGGRAGLLMGGLTCIAAAGVAAGILSQRGRALISRHSLRGA